MMTLAVVSAAAAVIAFLWTGLRVWPRALRATGASVPQGRVRLPVDLPRPVARFYDALGVPGDDAPRVDTFALWGRARMRRRPLPWLPVTFWSEHRVGWSGRQRLAVTWFGLPLLRARDTYRDGRGEMVIGGHRVIGPEIDQGENLFLWAELVLVPSVVVTRSGVCWEPVNSQAARLRVPFGDATDELVFHFAPDTDLVRSAHAMRYREVGGPKIGWRIDYRNWRRGDAGTYPGRIEVTWADQGGPWFCLDVDGMATNVPVPDDLARQPGSATVDRAPGPEA